jgi:hypothetical protein
MDRIQFPPRCPAKRNDQKGISSEFIHPTKNDPKGGPQEETKAKQLFVGDDA